MIAGSAKLTQRAGPCHPRSARAATPQAADPAVSLDVGRRARATDGAPRLTVRPRPHKTTARPLLPVRPRVVGLDADLHLALPVGLTDLHLRLAAKALLLERPEDLPPGRLDVRVVEV